MIKETIETLLEREGKLFSNLYFADKLNLTLNLYIVEKYRHRGFVLTSHHKRFKGMRVEFNQNQRSLNVFINVAKLKSWFELYKQNQYNIYNDFSLTLIHELAHLKDPRLSQHQLTLLGELAERYRSEGIALYSEYLASKKSAQIAFSWHVIYSANPLDSYAMMKEIKDKNEDHIYWLGFHMAITIVGAALFSKFNIQKSSFNANFMNDIRLLNKSYTPFIRDYIRILRNMNLTLFFKKYIQAAAYLKILPIFTPKFVEIILTRVK